MKRNNPITKGAIVLPIPDGLMIILPYQELNFVSIGDKVLLLHVETAWTMYDEAFRQILPNLNRPVIIMVEERFMPQIPEDIKLKQAVIGVFAYDSDKDFDKDEGRKKAAKLLKQYLIPDS